MVSSVTSAPTLWNSGICRFSSTSASGMKSTQLDPVELRALREGGRPPRGQDALDAPGGGAGGARGLEERAAVHRVNRS